MQKKKKSDIVIILITTSIVILILSAPVLMIFDIWDYFIYNKSVLSKENVFEMVLENQEEFKKAVEDMKCVDPMNEINSLEGELKYLPWWKRAYKGTMKNTIQYFKGL